MSTVELYVGHSVGAWTVADALPHEAGGLCPFDTGGLWHGHMETHPPLDRTPEARRAYFQECDRTLASWPQEVVELIDTAFASRAAYITGEPPTVAITPRDHSNNGSAMAWIWEGRIECATNPSVHVYIDRLFWKAQYRNDFTTWLDSYHGLSTDDKFVVADFLDDKSSVVDEPYASITTMLRDEFT